jgi:polar amino acid transport system substrate-binding protein
VGGAGSSKRRFSRVLLALIALIALIALVVSACAPSSATRESGLSRVRAAGVLRWGGDIQGGEPYVYDDPSNPGHLVGFEVDLADALAKELGVRAEFVQSDWSNLVASLERGVFDVALNGLEVTESRVGRVAFTRPYYVFAERLMARKGDASITATPDLSSLRGRRVGTLAGSLGFDMLRDGAETVLYEGTLEPYADLALGRTDAVLMDDIIAARYGMTRPELRVVGDLRDGYYAIAARPRDADLVEALDAATGRITERGELRRILEGHRLWNDRQARLTRWSPSDQAKMLGQPAPPPPLGAAQVVMFLRGALVTLVVSALAMVILAIPLGLALAVARLYGGPVLSSASAVYVEVFRGTPVLLQLYVLYFGVAPPCEQLLGAVASSLGAASTPRVPAVIVAVVGLGMNYAAYEAEVYRAAIQAVPPAQTESALALGMPIGLALRRIVLPQALRHAIPNVTNDFIALLKDSSLVSVITVVELTKQMTITAVDVRSWIGPGLLCAALYFSMSYPLGVLARRVERKLGGDRGVVGGNA